MLLSKTSVTLLSTVGASSVPLVSVVALYKIKSLSQGGNVEMSPVTSTEENVIAEATKTQPAKETKTETPQPVPPPPSNPSTISTTNPPAAPIEAKKDDKKDETSVPEKVEASPIKNMEITSTDEGEDGTKITTPKEATDFLNRIQELHKAILEGKTNAGQNDQDLSETIKGFKGLLETRKKTLSDKDEKKNISEVINALTKLEAKSSST